MAGKSIEADINIIFKPMDPNFYKGLNHEEFVKALDRGMQIVRKKSLKDFFSFSSPAYRSIGTTHLGALVALNQAVLPTLWRLSKLITHTKLFG